MKIDHFRNEFVEFVPDKLEEGVLYISMRYRTVAHLCACGCRKEVVTPLSPTDWVLSFNGAVTLSPSIGNWNFPCRAHYFIRGGRVRWAGEMSSEQIERGRALSSSAKERFYGAQAQPEPKRREPATTQPKSPVATSGLWGWIRSRIKL
ncbi:DUF6527 family protein [Pseudomonas glycinae]|uniref:DUF6527 family protein n=1 Tax=Pseudomonas glycinae TaxID=1785145 RepID=UPI0023DFFA9C|nr:DUF6527 family protein [Pseudomonas glycinae]